MSNKPTNYYVPEQSPWPFLSAFALFFVAWGAASFIQQNSGSSIVTNDGSSGTYLLTIGIAFLVVIAFLWFRDTIKESLANKNSVQMDVSYRMSMLWFIFSEVMLFAAFFGALFYIRLLAVPWLGGAGDGAMTHEILWPDFQAHWPLTTTPGGDTTQAMGPWGLPLINTLLLITSSITLTYAHHAIVKNHRKPLILWLALTIALGLVFLCLQMYEYVYAYRDLNLRFDSGIYGSTFFITTGLHGLHVTIGVTMLIIMLLRILKGHFTPENHFAFESTAWYWHFVDVVWLFLFVVVYWM